MKPYVRYWLVLLIVTVLTVPLASQSVAVAQPRSKSQPQGGDRRGTYSDPHKKGLSYKDPKTYIHNMTVIAHVPEGGGTDMMTIGDRRYVVGDRLVIDVTNPKEPAIVNRKAPRGEVAYNQSMKKWILMRTDSCCSREEEDLIKGGPSPELSYKDRLGVTFFDITDPRNPVEVSHYDTRRPGQGSHSDGNYYDGGRYAYLAAGVPGTRGQMPYRYTSRILVILDVSDMKQPKEAGRWWVPGQMRTEEKEHAAWLTAVPEHERWSPNTPRHMYNTFHGPCFVPKRVEDGGNRGYCAWGALGFVILDLTDIKKPRQVSRLSITPPFDGGIPVHTTYPMLERGLVFMNGEVTTAGEDCNEGVIMPWVVDIRAEKNPVTIATFPIPKPPPEAPYTDFCFKGRRFGPHDAQNFKAPGEARQDIMAYSWFNGGFRLYDVSNPFQPREVATFVPPMGDRRGSVERGLIEWDRKLVHVRTDTGLYILSSPVLGEPVLGPMKPKRWAYEGVNKGAPQ